MGEFGVGLKISSINGQLRAKGTALRSNSDQRLAFVNQEVGQANERATKNEMEAAGLTKEAAQLRKDAEAEHFARVNIEAANAFRSLDGQQKGDIGTALTRFGSATFAGMWFANGSPEAELFADDIAEALSSAHIHTTTIGGLIDMREGGGNWDAPIESADTGVDISSTSNPAARELAGALFKELTSRGFDAKRQPDQKSKNNPPRALFRSPYKHVLKGHKVNTSSGQNEKRNTKTNTKSSPQKLKNAPLSD